MPELLRRPARYPPQRVVTAREVAIALRPETDRSGIPNRVNLDTGGVPFAGEFREEQHRAVNARIKIGATVTIATLRRPWNYVGFIVDPGSSTVSFQAYLRVLTRGLSGVVTPSQLTIQPGLGPQASTALIMGAVCELIVTNPTGEGSAQLSGVRGTIWGQSES